MLAVTFVILLITFANNLDPDQDRQNVNHDMDPNCLTLIMLLEEFFESYFEKKSRQMTTKT